MLKDALNTPLRGSPRITLEEIDGDELIVRISATPQNAADGPELATEVLRAIAPQVRGGVPADAFERNGSQVRQPAHAGAESDTQRRSS
jgi:hypothetical protein